MDALERLKTWSESESRISKVVDFVPGSDQLLPLDFTERNHELRADIINDTATFSAWVDNQLHTNHCLYGIGGYDEHRTIYTRSAHFDTEEEPRRLHLGVDIWAKAGTNVYSFYDAEVHSFKNNAGFGDYGATIILKYNLEGLTLFALYGHLSLASLNGLAEGQQIASGAAFATFGIPAENGNWPPHLHFQLMFNMQGSKGDYPGVCQYSKRDIDLKNCPDPNIILQHTFSPNPG